ncbi:Na+/H+ antiporter [Xylophilus sp.]|uniref:Na+/H+ antiporter n=1 Tax=Xylophilus sp. TaxID=2653893 RepID=UPI0013BAC5CE|nr:Na+/H+ antiporter [Xylophilus sp.]KAF1043903.1 MAG: Sodium, potassium, lithium and rubidium/H(+) antiporter [Xylophilus sp.]
MDSTTSILAMLALVAGSGLVARWLPRLPLPLLQITLGAALAWQDTGLALRMDPQVFMLLFVPPLLFADGWQSPKREFGANMWAILLLAVGLVLATVLVVGYFIHWTLPDMPLSVAFVLAAVLSPTDALAVSAISHGQPMPARLRHLLEGEAMMNDASALVAVKFAVAATVTQRFSLPQAGLELLHMAGIGLGVGVLFSIVFCHLHDRLLRARDDRPVPAMVLLLLLMPFAPYLIAEHWGGSGVLAAVAAGMTASLIDVKSSRFNPNHVQTQATWDVVSFAFNGLVFVLLGQQLPPLLRHLPRPPEETSVELAPHHPVAALAVGTLSIAVLVLALRFAWLAVGTWGPAWLDRLRRQPAVPPREPVSLALVGAGALGGTRGGITLAAVLGVPLTLVNGRAFPARDLLVFQSAMIVVITLVLASIGLPWLLRRIATVRQDSRGARELAWARQRATRAALHAMETAPADDDGHHGPAVRERIRQSYGARLRVAARDADARDGARRALAQERSEWLRVLQAEREELRRLRRRHRINDETLRTLLREIDAAEAAVRHAGGALAGH